MAHEARHGSLAPSFRYPQLEFGGTAGFVAELLGLGAAVGAAGQMLAELSGQRVAQPALDALEQMLADLVTVHVDASFSSPS